MTQVTKKHKSQNHPSHFTFLFTFFSSGGSTFARVKLKEIDGMAPQDVERAV